MYMLKILFILGLKILPEIVNNHFIKILLIIVGYNGRCIYLKKYIYIIYKAERIIELLEK